MHYTRPSDRIDDMQSILLVAAGDMLLLEANASQLHLRMLEEAEMNSTQRRPQSHGNFAIYA